MGSEQEHNDAIGYEMKIDLEDISSNTPERQKKLMKPGYLSAFSLEFVHLCYVVYFSIKIEAKERQIKLVFTWMLFAVLLISFMLQVSFFFSIRSFKRYKNITMVYVVVCFVYTGIVFSESLELLAISSIIVVMFSLLHRVAYRKAMQ